MTSWQLSFPNSLIFKYHIKRTPDFSDLGQMIGRTGFPVQENQCFSKAFWHNKDSDRSKDKYLDKGTEDFPVFISLVSLRNHGYQRNQCRFLQALKHRWHPCCSDDWHNTGHRRGLTPGLNLDKWELHVTKAKINPTLKFSADAWSYHDLNVASVEWQ